MDFTEGQRVRHKATGQTMVFLRLADNRRGGQEAVCDIGVGGMTEGFDPAALEPAEEGGAGLAERVAHLEEAVQRMGQQLHQQGMMLLAMATADKKAG